MKNRANLNPGMTEPAKLSRFVKLLLNKTKSTLTKISLRSIPYDLWNIVVEYVCEDPEIVDIISNGPHVIYAAPGKLKLTSDHDSSLILIFGECNTLGKHGEVFRIILNDSMVLASFGSPESQDFPELTWLRELLYKKLETRRSTCIACDAEFDE